MASVWLARDRRDDRAVEIKVLDADLAGAIGADRFVREIRLTTRLLHPGIVPVLDSGVLPAGTDVALPWYAMPYIPGESLRARLQRETQLPIGDAVRIARAIAGALLVANRQWIVHRDIKPENVILSGDDVFVVDFGIAKALLETGAERLTSTGLAVGTPVYMSPEQATAAPVDARTDQYSLAAVLYEMLVGEPPVTGPNTQAIIARRLTAPVQSIRTVRPTVPAALETAVLRALERVPADRFPDVAAFAAALDSASDPAMTPSRRARLGRAREDVRQDLRAPIRAAGNLARQPAGARRRLRGPRARRRQHRRTGVGGAGDRAASDRSERRRTGHSGGQARDRARLPRRACVALPRHESRRVGGHDRGARRVAAVRATRADVHPGAHLPGDRPRVAQAVRQREGLGGQRSRRGPKLSLRPDDRRRDREQPGGAAARHRRLRSGSPARERRRDPQHARGARDGRGARRPISRRACHVASSRFARLALRADAAAYGGLRRAGVCAARRCRPRGVVARELSDARGPALPASRALRRGARTAGERRALSRAAASGHTPRGLLRRGGTSRRSENAYIHERSRS